MATSLTSRPSAGSHGLHGVVANFQSDDNVDRILAASGTHIEQYTASARRPQRTSPHRTREAPPVTSLRRESLNLHREKSVGVFEPETRYLIGTPEPLVMGPVHADH
ncbi:hypothetical protein [Streptomyces canus]|uniref:hypothetical protein n=1 Tax=Streptomyces canus TaxID=58343 RepID=UPI0030DF4160